MANRIRRFWDQPRLWQIALCILFGYDCANMELSEKFDSSEMLALFSKKKVLYPESLVIITSMLQSGLKDTMKNIRDPEAPAKVPSDRPVPPRQGPCEQP